jgi:MFS family permease
LETDNRPDEPAPAAPRPTPSPWSPFTHSAFAVIWTATLVSNVGSWMYSAACGWLMTSLDPSPLMVSLVQVATSLPMFLFAMPAGALTDGLDKRRFLFWGEVATTAAAAVFAVLVWLHMITATRLLVFSFLVAAGGALTAPGWQAVTPLLVPRRELTPAVAANSVGVNISRVLGPALGGLFLGWFGLAAPFVINAASNLAVVGALAWWRPPKRALSQLPPEHLWSAITTGLRYARYNEPLSATLIRSGGFFIFASAYWALLPLVARSQIAGGPTLYGVLLGVIGAGAVSGALALPWLNRRLGPDRLAVGGTLGTAAAMALFGLAHDLPVALLASALAGASWIASLSSLNISAQIALPEWVRGRGLAIYVTVMFGALSLGSVIWGAAASTLGVSVALYIAAAGGAAAVVVLRRWKLHEGAGMDLSPAQHWPAPITTGDFDHDRGPVLVAVTYHIDPHNRGPFLEAIKALGRERRRDGSYRWSVFEDPADNTRFVEIFMDDSWLDHLRHHERVTNADRSLEAEVRRFQVGEGPETSHLLAATPGRR